MSGDHVPQPIVALGASAGGLAALESFFAAVPIDTPAAYVVIQHLSPAHESRMDEILSRTTALEVRRARTGDRPRAGTVYVMQPGTEMLLSSGELVVTEREAGRDPSYPIDAFFRSAAQDAGRLAVGVILSGTGADGSRGLSEIHEAGGLSVCQTPSSAHFSGMPQAALDAAVVDLVLEPDRMPGPIHRYLVEETGALPPGPSKDRELIGRATKVLREQVGIDFSAYKPSTVSRRLRRRVLLRDEVSLDSYVEHLEDQPEEVRALYADLLIGVTRFFRDESAWESLVREFLVPRLRAREGIALRIWVAGCATGEEAYTTAILMDELARTMGRRERAKIFATDVDAHSLDVAARGVYQADSLNGLSDERRERYFRRTGNGFEITPSLRRQVVFARHDIVRAPPFTRLDLICCRNLLIYLRPQVQRKVLSQFLFGLKRGGGLFLGKSESPRSLEDDFEVLDTRHRIYVKPSSSRVQIDYRSDWRPVSPPDVSHTAGSQPSLLHNYDLLLDRFMPAALLVSQDGALLHSFGGASSYLQMTDGRPGSSVIDMLPESVRDDLKERLTRVAKSGRDEHVKTEIFDKPVMLSLSRLAGTALSPFLITFHDSADSLDTQLDGDEQDPELAARSRIATLEAQLRRTKERLQSTVEQLETSNEELQSSNEELMASNEELHGTNEELQSVNEELHTVNSELQSKVDELTVMTHDMENLLDSMEVGTVFLDRSLKIRRSTPIAKSFFRIHSEDLGRSIEDFRTSLRYESLYDDLRTVLRDGARLDREVRQEDGHWMLLRLRPYMVDGDVDGVVLTLIDVDAFKEAEERVRKAVMRRDEYIAMLSHEIRNPLSAIVSAVDLSRARGAGRLEGRVLDIVDRQSRQLSRILDDLLDFSRIARGKMELRRERTDLRVVLKSAADSIGLAASERGIEVHRSFPDHPVPVVGDPARLEQVLSNILRNAVKYGSEAGNVWIDCTMTDSHAVVAIRDDGIGMDPDLLDAVFEPFVQTPGNIARSEGGMGVGLAVVNHLVRAHGGQVLAHSAGVNQGCEFVVRLPVADDVSNSEEASDRPDRGHHILLVEDSDDARTTMASLLEEAGYEVEMAADGVSAIESISQSLPRLGLIDIAIPAPDGYQVARHIRGLDASIPLIALTGRGLEADHQHAKDAGFDRHLTKPVAWKDLEKILEALTAAPQRRDDERG